MASHKRSALKLLIHHLVGLVDEGQKEELDITIEKMRNEEFISYLLKKYPSFVNFTEGTYPMSEINKDLAAKADYADGNEFRKFSVKNNGLNLAITLINEIAVDAN